MGNFEIISEDLFGIAKRLKLIDKCYILVRNKKKNRFEIWYDACIPHLELILKNKKLDKRVLDFVNESRIENIDKYIKIMDKQNECLVSKEIEKVKKDSIDKLSEELKYVK